MNSVETANDRQSVHRSVSESVGRLVSRSVPGQSGYKKQSHSQTTLLVPLLEIGELDDNNKIPSFCHN